MQAKRTENQVRKSPLFLWALMLFVVQPVAGQDFPGLPQDGDQIRYVSNTGVHNWGVYIGPYGGQAMNYPGQPSITMYCVDFGHYASTAPWSVFSTALDGSESMSQTRLGNDGLANPYERYVQTAFLASLFGTVTPNATNWSPLHGAIWTITSPSFVSAKGAPYGNAASWDYFGASNNWTALTTSFATEWAAFDPSGWYVLTDMTAFGQTGAYTGLGRQEFLVYRNVVPEPETYVLLLTGLLGIFFVARRRLKENGYA